MSQCPSPGQPAWQRLTSPRRGTPAQPSRPHHPAGPLGPQYLFPLPRGSVTVLFVTSVLSTCPSGCIFSLPTPLVPTPCRSPSSLICTEPLVVIPTPAPPPLLVLFAKEPDYISLLSNDILFVLVYPTRLPVAQEQGCLIFSCAL